jgi:signal transduction histidine kinase
MHLVLDPPPGGHLPDLASCYQAFVGHELPNQLVALQGIARLLGEGGLDPEDARSLTLRLAEIARRADQVSRRLADLGRELREPAWGLPTSPAAEALEAAAEACAALPGSSLVVDADDEGMTVECSSRLLRLVFRELFVNSGRQTPRATVRVTARRDGEAVRIAVADDGPGMRAEQAPLLLEPFRAGRRENAPGPGVGFFLVRQAAALWRAPLSVTSGPGQGLRVEMRIPPAPKEVR